MTAMFILSTFIGIKAYSMLTTQLLKPMKLYNGMRSVSHSTLEHDSFFSLLLLASPEYCSQGESELPMRTVWR